MTSLATAPLILSAGGVFALGSPLLSHLQNDRGPLQLVTDRFYQPRARRSQPAVLVALLLLLGGQSNDWRTLCIVPLMSKRTECIVDNGGGCAELSVSELV